MEMGNFLFCIKTITLQVVDQLISTQRVIIVNMQYYKTIVFFCYDDTRRVEWNDNLCSLCWAKAKNFFNFSGIIKEMKKDVHAL